MNESSYATVLIIAEILFVFMVLRTLGNAGAKKSTLAVIGLAFVAWLIIAYGILATGFFSATAMPQVSFSVAVTIPVVLGYLAIRLWKPLGQAVAAIPTENFLLLQHWRAVFGVLFFFTSALPAWFQYIGGLGDIAAGIGAFFALKYFRQHPDKERQAIIRGNFVGILDFIVVLSLGVFVVLRDHSPDIMFNLIPLVVVPFFLLLHVFSLMRLGKVGGTA